MTLRTKDPELAHGAPVSDSALATLKQTFRGQLIQPDDAGYDAARQVWNAMIDHRPVLVARCLGVADVVSTIGFAREHGLDLSVRGGGHSIVGHSMVDGSVVVDLSLMRGVRVDRRARRARVQGGAWIADLDRETQHFGLATTGGLVADTGIAGLTLGGGYGWLARRFGLAADNVRGAEVVTADGSVRDVSADEHPDLFWALRGGGGNFGVATELEFELHPFGPMVSSGDVYYQHADGMAALRAFRESLADAPDELYLMAFAHAADERTPVPEEHRGRPIVGLSWAWLGDEPRDGERVAQPLHGAGRPIAQFINSMTYVALQTGPERPAGPRTRAYWKASFLSDLSDDILEGFLGASLEANRSGPRASGEIISMGGAVGRVGEDDTAYSGRDALVDFLAVSGWTDPAEDATRIAAARGYWEAVTAGGSTGVYVNNLGSEGQGRVVEAYGAAKYARLAEVKRRYDPDNVFHHNQNIAPAASD